jgi:hypothetical protein
MQTLAGRKCDSSGLEQQKGKLGKHSATNRRTLKEMGEMRVIDSNLSVKRLSA